MNDKEVAKKALAELDSAFIDVTIHAQAAFALVRYVRDLEMQLTALQKQITAAAQPSRAEVLETWRPIETAPKTGCTLLLGYPNVLGKWRTVRGQWMSEAYIAENWEEPDDAEAGWYETSAEADDVPNCWPITPTHWMPLPAAPEAKP